MLYNQTKYIPSLFFFLILNMDKLQKQLLVLKAGKWNHWNSMYFKGAFANDVAKSSGLF